MTQKIPWSAIIAPTGATSQTGQTIDPTCTITIRDGAPLINQHGKTIGRVLNADTLAGYVIAIGELHVGCGLPDVQDDQPMFEVEGRTFHQDAQPMFEVDPFDPGRTFHQDGSATFHSMKITCVLVAPVGSTSAWPDDPNIGFCREWCVNISDDLVPMPDYATAERSADRFNRWWNGYRAGRGDDVTLPELSAAAIPWPYPTAEHTTALAELRAYDPDGWLPDLEDDGTKI